jgi:hypothetical protein
MSPRPDLPDAALVASGAVEPDVEVRSFHAQLFGEIANGRAASSRRAQSRHDSRFQLATTDLAMMHFKSARVIVTFVNVAGRVLLDSKRL